LTRSPRRLSSSLLRKLEGIIGDVVVTFELQLLDPSPFVYADPGKTLPSVSPLRPHFFLMTVHVACWGCRGRWVLPVVLDEAHCCCCRIVENIFWDIKVTSDTQLLRTLNKRKRTCQRKRTSTDKPLERTYGARPGSELHRLIFEPVLLQKLIKCNAY